MWMTRVSVDNPILATMVMAALAVLGLFSWQRLAVEEFPDVRFPIAVVSTGYPGASPVARARSRYSGVACSPTTCTRSNIGKRTP